MEISTGQQTQLLRHRSAIFWVLLLGYIGYYLIRQNLPAAFPLMQTAFKFSNADLGLMAALSELVYALGKFINGPLADKIGGKKIFLLGLAGGIVCNLVFAYGSTLLWFIVVWCLCRYFLSMGWGGIAKAVGDWYEPERHGTVMGWISLSFQFGGVVATLFAGWLVSMGQSWQQLFLWPAGVCVLLWMAALLIIRDHPSDVISGADFRGTEPKASLAAFEDQTDLSTRQIISTLSGMKIFRYLLVFAFFNTFLRSIFTFWTAKFLVDIGMGQTSAIFNSALLPFLGCVGTVLLGWYTDKYARDNRARAMWVMLTGLFVSLVGIALCLEAGAGAGLQIPIVLLLGLSGFFLFGPDGMSVGALTLDIAGPRGAGTCSGFIDGVGYLGGALATWGAGLMSDLLGWSQVFWMLAVCSIFSVTSAFLLSRHFNKVGEESLK